MRATEIIITNLKSIVENLKLSWSDKVVVEPCKNPKHGDLATNIAMVMAKDAKCKPQDLAHKIAENIQTNCAEIASAQVAGPGFLNLTFTPTFWHKTILEILEKTTDFGASSIGQGKKTLVEYVSANPTGPLHVGHGRGAAVGDSLTRLLRFAGFDVSTEYYINDAGKQMNILGLSVYLRAKELKSGQIDIPKDFYKGEYIIDIAKNLLEKEPNLLDLDEDYAKHKCFEYAMPIILDGIKKDLSDFKVEHQGWYSEKSLTEKNAVQDTFNLLKEKKLSYELDNALWFSSTLFGDDKDRVLKKSDGSLTYFASDIAYHYEKYARGFEYIIDIWGADHHGYIPRMQAAIEAMGHDKSSFAVVLIQLVNLLKDNVPLSMSTRAGTFETLADVIEEAGVDATRFMFLSRKSDSPLDFDLELVKKRTMDNPVYYVQYAHARICAVKRRALSLDIIIPEKITLEDLSSLTSPEDVAIIRLLERFKKEIVNSASNLATHHISHYLLELSAALHSYYAKHQVIQDSDLAKTKARLIFFEAIAQVLKNGLNILGVSAPDYM